MTRFERRTKVRQAGLLAPPVRGFQSNTSIRVRELGTLRAVYFAVGILLTLFSIPLVLGRVPPNHLCSFRVPATLADSGLSYGASRLAGRCLFIAGLVTVAVAAGLDLILGLVIDNYALALPFIEVAMLTEAVILSFR